ncbi:mannitol dehydrogenase family protein [Pseudomonas putida]|uniref:mannitol dehydrogenase family protein n=1 Tax=Pseudomonas putida TaxID=303 RepID=UPI0023648AE1|nr:mannitol dehydrogenase family protein [Pseudomonas putida]MDD2001941.1 mannitol dehydrogenase family protein [Pseudomonas putida]
MTVKLSLENISDTTFTVSVPNYDRATLSAGIVHFGVGNFHRAHQAIYLDELFNSGTDHDWAVIGAGILPSDATMREKLAAQDYLTTVVEQDINRNEARITGPMIGMLPVGDTKVIIEGLADPKIRIVSMTITEGGYFIDASGKFNPEHPAILADGKNPTEPKTIFGLIVAALKIRKENGIAPFTVMSCDNIPHNGVVTANAVIGTAELSDSSLAKWIRQEVSFPNAMVDRITPATSAREISHCVETFGIDDCWPVYCEEFKQWVIEDKFSAGRPALEKVGVQFVSDVTPYEHMKIRILNGGHAALAYPAALLDIHFVHEAMDDLDIRAFLRKLEEDEIIPIVPPVPNTDLNQYYEIIERRFSNPKVADTIPRLTHDGSNRHPKFILPSTADNLKIGKDVVGLALVSALWCRFLLGQTDSGHPILATDPNLEEIQIAARQAVVNPDAFLSLEGVFGTLGKNDRFRARFAQALSSLQTAGVRSTLRSYVSGRLDRE